MFHCLQTQKQFDRRGEMNFHGNEHYRLNRRLLLLVGLWPYERSTFKYFQMVLCNVIVMYTMACQIMKLTTLKRDVDLILRIFSPVTICLACVIKYQTFCIIPEKIKYLMDHVEKDWSMLRNRRELEIMERHTYIGNMYTLSFTIIGFLAVLICSLLPLAPNILDSLVPLNVSRPRELLFPGEYLVDQQKYFYVILLHLDITLFIVVTTLVGTETLYVTHVQHACGMFQVASYRMDQAFDDKFSRAYVPEKKTIVVYKRVIEAVRIHRRALEFSEFLGSSLVVSYSILLTIGVLSLVINLFCLLQAALITKDLSEMIKLGIFIIGQISYIFLGNYIAQTLMDNSTSVFEKTYITRWHDAPVQVQKLLPIIMQRSIRSCKLVMVGVFVSSLEGFASLMSTTMSYFTVLWSVHK